MIPSAWIRIGPYGRSGEETLVPHVLVQMRPGGGNMIPSAWVRAGPHGRSAEKISAQTHSEASMESAGPLPIPCSSAGDQSEAGSIGVGDGDKSLDDGTLVSQNAGERPTILRDLAMSVPSCVFSHTNDTTGSAISEQEKKKTPFC